ncbi:MAG: carbohydrate kinase family protein [Anaerolineae bacterium]|nr:carbohydrate kinase family protein [Anaerolineae bacterium]
MNNQPQIVGLGLATLDVLIRLNDMPTWEGHSRADGFRFDGGGLVGTAMVAAAKLGAQVGFIGTAGTDESADLKLKSFRECGVDLSHLVRRNGPDDHVMLVFVHSETGERVFAGVRGGHHQSIQPEELDKAYITGADYLHIDAILHHEAMLSAVQWMKTAGKTVTMDGSKTNGVVGKEHRALIPYVDVLITGEGYGRGLTGHDDIWAAGDQVLEMGPRVFIETRGDQGCFGVTREERFHIPAFDVDVIDTTGAGDVFHGAYIVGMIHGWTPQQCAQFSAAVSAIKCMKLGGRAGIPTFEQTMTFLQERGIEW